MSATLIGELASLMGWLRDPSRTIVAHLAKNAIADSIDSLALTDLVECDFPGYAPITLSEFTPEFIGDDAYGEANSQECAWTISNPTAMQGITCVYLTITDGLNTHALLRAYPLFPPTTLAEDGDTFLFSFVFQSASESLLPSVFGEV